MNMEEDEDLLYIAELALDAPLPPVHTVHLDQNSVQYFFNITSSYEYPPDMMYLVMYHNAKAKKEALIRGTATTTIEGFQLSQSKIAAQLATTAY
jgi:hypothetical protein